MKLHFLIILIICPFYAFSDEFAYSEKMHMQIESENYIVIHAHDWSDFTLNERTEMFFSEKQDPFDDKNNYGYIECINKKDNQIIFHIPSPALTQLFISPDEKYIAGISNIMLYNPYQLVVLDINGDIIKRRHISSEEVKLNNSDFIYFRNKFSKLFQILYRLHI